MASYVFTYISVAASEEKMLDDLALIIEENSIVAETANRLKLTVSEAFTNALIHGNGRDPGKKIRIEIVVNEHEILADIIDEGRDGLARIAGRKPPVATSENGRGINLIAHCAEEARFVEGPTGGLVVSLRFARRESNRHIKEGSV